MKVPHAAKSTTRISDCTFLIGGALCGVLGFTLLLPLALSSPYPTLKQGDGGIRPAPSQPAPVRTASVQQETKPSMERPAFAEPSPLVEGAMFTLSSAEPETPAETTSSVERIPSVVRVSFADRWNLTIAASVVASSVSLPPEVARLEVPQRLETAATSDTADRHPAPSVVRRRDMSAMEEVDHYLWEVYQRQPVKSDSSGDFTWKDPAAAKRRGISLQSYVIGGMDADFREQLYHAGHAMDGDGIHWSMLSAFRDDYRQSLAAGFKARSGNSKHGGSRATGGYGHGQAVDITTADGDAGAARHWIDAHGARYGLHRPIPGPDPAHVQPHNKWHEIALALRNVRVKLANQQGAEGKTQVAGISK
jgi:hypothetical protein